jgi:hypothetical protein
MTDKDSELCRGRVLNVNDSGFCAILYKPISEGQEIRIEKGHKPFPCKKAMVRWAKGFQLDVYIVGFECKTKGALSSSEQGKKGQTGSSNKESPSM